MPMSMQRDGYNLKGSESNVKPSWALPVIAQVGQQFLTKTFTAGTDFTIPAGGAATVVKIQMPFSGILGSKGRVGRFGNSSFAFGGAAATTFTTEVAFIGDLQQEGGDATTLTNGQYMIDYETGVIYGKKADAGTTGTAAYSFFIAAAGTNINNTLGVDGVQITPLASSVYSYSVFKDLSANATLNIKASNANVFSAKCHNLNAAARYLQLFNTATFPAGGAVPDLVFLLPPTSETKLGTEWFGAGGINFTLGVAFGFSTTELTYTAGVAADEVTFVNFK